MAKFNEKIQHRGNIKSVPGPPPKASLLGLNEAALVGSHELCIRQICDGHLEVHSNVSSVF